MGLVVGAQRGHSPGALGRSRAAPKSEGFKQLSSDQPLERETWTSLWTSPRGRAGRGRAARQLESGLGWRGPQSPLVSDG